MKSKSLTAELVTEDIPGTIEFYTRVLEFELHSVYPSDNPQWVQFRCMNDYLMFESRESLAKIIPEMNRVQIGGSFDIYIEVEDIEELYENLRSKVEVVVQLTERPFRQFAVRDVNGYVLLFGQHD
jgi:uncharacterized glyoxalase superfamily protein PhnB